MNFVGNNKIFKQIYLYIELMQGISTIFADQMPSFHVFRNAGIKIFNISPHSLRILNNENIQFEAAVKYLSTHFFNFADEFFMCKDDP
jgi:hypothetical protein